MKTIKDIKNPGHAGMRAGLLAYVARKSPTKENLAKASEAKEEFEIVRKAQKAAEE